MPPVGWAIQPSIFKGEWEFLYGKWLRSKQKLEFLIGCKTNSFSRITTGIIRFIFALGQQ
jgi:hypothetical protein